MNPIARIRDWFRHRRSRLVEESASLATGSSILTDYSPDLAITRSEEDRFSRAPFAHRIADLIATRTDRTGLVIGLYGPWGDGKTSVLEMLRGRLEGAPHVKTIFFNPWYFTTELQLIQSFFKTLAHEFKLELDPQGRWIGHELENYKDMIGSGAAAVSSGVAVATGIPPVAGPVVGHTLSRVIGYASRKIADRTKSLQQQKELINNALIKSRRRLVVVIDDIDRLSRDEILALFKLVRLTGDFANTIYILAFDDRVVTAALDSQYTDSLGETGRSYLEKIIQIPLHLPPAATSDIKGLVYAEIYALLDAAGIEFGDEQKDQFLMCFEDGLSPALRTPRQARRYLNALRFAVPALKGEVNIVDQLLLEGIRTLYPRLYSEIRKRSSLFLETGFRSTSGDAWKAMVQTTITSAMKNHDVDVATVQTELIEYLFPRVGASLGRAQIHHTDEHRWRRDQRVASPAYFQRYFTYAVPQGDLPDQEVFRLIRRLDQDSNAVEAFREVARPEVMSKLIDKLYTSFPEITSRACNRLATQLAAGAVLIPRDNVIDSVMRQTARLVRKCVEAQKTKEERFALATGVTQEAEPLAFGLECMRWFAKQDREASALFTEEEEGSLGSGLAFRVQKLVTDKAVTILGRDTYRAIWFWHTYGNREELVAYLQTRFIEHPGEMEDFLIQCGPVMLSNGFPAEMDLSHYKSIAGIVDAEFVANMVHAKYGLPPSKLGEEELDEFFDYDDHRRKTALGFLHWHIMMSLVQSRADAAA